MTINAKADPTPGLGRRFVLWLAIGWPAGLSPIAPGTVGSLWGLPLAWSLGLIESVPIRLALIVAICLVGIPICTSAAKTLGQGKDPGAIVFDEIAALPITFLFIEINSITVAVLGFVLFRVFDVLKPPPARQLERLPDGLGVMADDWVAGIYANLVLHALAWAH